MCCKNKLQPEFDFESEELKAVYQQHEAELLSVAEKEARDYMLDVWAWDSKPGEDFPCGKEMTGEWYVGRAVLFIVYRFCAKSMQKRSDESCNEERNHEAGLVERSSCLSDLSPQFYGFKWRRNWEFGRNYTLPLAQMTFQTQFGTNDNLAFASYLFALIPILIFDMIC